MQADKSIPKRRVRLKQQPPWWTNELKELRQSMRPAHRRMNSNPVDSHISRREYNKERKNFVKHLRKEKKASWRRFAGEIRDEKWGRCFRWIKKGSAEHEAPSVLKKPNGEYTKTLREILQHLLDTLIKSGGTEQYSIQEPPKVRLDHKETNYEEVRTAI